MYRAGKLEFLICLTPCFQRISKHILLINLVHRHYLHLNIQQHNLALRALLLNRHLASAVAVAAKLGVLDEAVLRNKGLERVHSDEVVVDGVALARAGGARGVRHGEDKGIGVALEEELVERALADARGAGDDEGAAVGGDWLRVLVFLLQRAWWARSRGCSVLGERTVGHCE